MAIKNKDLGPREMKKEEFTRWLLKKFDEDGDEKISEQELGEAIRAHGGWFSRWKGSRALRCADKNGDGIIDPSEIPNLAELAQKYFNITVTV